jgi:hypothetical protein
MSIRSCCQDRTLYQFSVNLCSINSCPDLEIFCVDFDQPTKIHKLYMLSVPLQGVLIHIFHGVFWEISLEDCCPVLVLCFLISLCSTCSRSF